MELCPWFFLLLCRYINLVEVLGRVCIFLSSTLLESGPASPRSERKMPQRWAYSQGDGPWYTFGRCVATDKERSSSLAWKGVWPSYINSSETKNYPKGPSPCPCGEGYSLGEGLPTMEECTALWGRGSIVDTHDFLAFRHTAKAYQENQKKEFENIQEETRDNCKWRVKEIEAKYEKPTASRCNL